MKLAISGEMLGYTYCPEEVFRLISGHGVKYVEIWPNNCVPEKGKKTRMRLFANRDIEATMKLLEKYGLEACCVSFGGAFDESLVNDTALYNLELIRAVRTAKRFGAKLVNHYCHYISHGEDFDRNKAESYWSSALEQAERLDVCLALENEAHDMVRTAENMHAAVSYFGSRCFKTNFDATNYYQASQEAFPHCFNVLKEDLVYVHIKNGVLYDPKQCLCDEWIGGSLSGMYAPGKIYYTRIADGAVNIPGMLENLSKSGYEGWCTLEPHSTGEEIIKYYNSELDYLRGLRIFEA